jgi:hypothetical protein
VAEFGELTFYACANFYVTFLACTPPLRPYPGTDEIVSISVPRGVDPAALGACATRPGHAVNMLAEERLWLCKQHRGAASMQLHGCARHCRQLYQSLRALKSCVPLAPSQPHSRRVMPGELVYGASWARSYKKYRMGSEKTPPSRA